MFALIVLALGGDGRQQPKSVEMKSIYGDTLRRLEEESYSSTAHPKALLIGMPIDRASNAEANEAVSDRLFEGYAGPRAEEMGYRRVLIRPDDSSDPGGIEIFGFKLSMHVDVGPGPANLDDGLIAYNKSPDGTWDRNGFHPNAPSRIRTFKLASGATFALTNDLVDFPSGTFVYDCLSCTTENAAREFSRDFYPFLQEITTNEPSMRGLTAVNIAVFLAPRRSAWEFPELLKIAISKRNGQWRATWLSQQQLEQLIRKNERTTDK